MTCLSYQSYFYNDDTFNFNYAQAKAAVGNYREAEEVLHSTAMYYTIPHNTTQPGLEINVVPLS